MINIISSLYLFEEEIVKGNAEQDVGKNRAIPEVVQESGKSDLVVDQSNETKISSMDGEAS